MQKKKIVPAVGCRTILESPEADYDGAVELEGARVGRDCLFLEKAFKVEYIPLKEIKRCYRRIEEASASVCCGRVSFPTSYVMLVYAEGERRKLPMKTESGADRLLEELGKLENVAVGYDDELANNKDKEVI